MSLLHWLAVHLGMDKSAGPSVYYSFWSGTGSDIGEVTIIGALLAGARHLNCHNRGCWRVGRHVTKDGYKLCRRHVAMPLDDLELHPVHPDHAGTS